MEQTYDTHQSYDANYESGPRFSTPLPEIPETPLETFVGIPVRSRLGIAAGLLLNSNWIRAYADRGFDILTYKTVRSKARASYPPPNWVWVDEPDPTDPAVRVREKPSDDPLRTSAAVCFGMPSKDPAVWREDVRRAREALRPGQVLVVSVVGSPGPRPDEKELADDFARCAVWAAESGAQVVEANFSCPNVCTAEGDIFKDAALSGRMAAVIRDRLGSTPLLLKIGQPDSPESLEPLMLAVAPFVSGLTLVNGITRPVLHPDGRPAFGPDFPSAGVIGRALHPHALATVRRASALRQRLGLDLALVAVGGAAAVPDIQEFLQAGADAVLAGSSPMYHPELALEWKRQGTDPTRS